MAGGRAESHKSSNTNGLGVGKPWETVQPSLVMGRYICIMSNMKAKAFNVTRWNDPSPLQTFDTFEEAQDWVMSHFSEWTTFLIEPVFEG